MLRALAEGLWIADAPQRFAGMELGARMAVVALPQGGLLLHSPVRPSVELRAALDRLGPVRALIAPNLYHHSHARAYLDAYPGAQLYGCPRLDQKRRDLPLAGVLGADLQPWFPALEHRHIAGNPTHEEVVSYHRASRSLLVADLVSNFVELRGLRMRCFGALNGWGRFSAPRMLRWMVRDRAAARRSLQEVLAWDFERVIVAHGAVLPTGGHTALASALGWLLRPPARG
jgi:hypothetical protein